MDNSPENDSIELPSEEMEGLTLCDSTEMSLAPSEMPFTMPESLTGSVLPASFAFTRDRRANKEWKTTKATHEAFRKWSSQRDVQTSVNTSDGITWEWQVEMSVSGVVGAYNITGELKFYVKEWPISKGITRRSTLIFAVESMDGNTLETSLFYGPSGCSNIDPTESRGLVPEDHTASIHKPWELSTIRMNRWINANSNENLAHTLLVSRLGDDESQAFKDQVLEMVREIYEHGRTLQEMQNAPRSSLTSRLIGRLSFLGRMSG